MIKTTQNITGATDRASVVMFPYVGPRMTRCRLRGYRRTQMLEVNKARDKMEGGLQEAQAVSPHVLPAVKLWVTEDKKHLKWGYKLFCKSEEVLLTWYSSKCFMETRLTTSVKWDVCTEHIDTKRRHPTGRHLTTDTEVSASSINKCRLLPNIRTLLAFIDTSHKL